MHGEDRPEQPTGESGSARAYSQSTAEEAIEEHYEFADAGIETVDVAELQQHFPDALLSPPSSGQSQLQDSGLMQWEDRPEQPTGESGFARGCSQSTAEEANEEHIEFADAGIETVDVSEQVLGHAADDNLAYDPENVAHNVEDVVEDIPMNEEEGKNSCGSR